MWWMAAGMALNALSGINQASVQEAQDDLHNAIGAYNQEQSYNKDLKVQNDQLAVTTATNQALIEANTKNTLAANVKAGLLNMQLGMTKKSLAQDRANLNKTREQVLGAVNANAAAAGTVGPSVEAVKADVNRTIGESMVKTEEQWDIQAQNYQTQLGDLYSNLENSLGSASVSRVSAPVKGMVVEQDNARSTGNILLGSIASGAMNYAQARMKLDMFGTNT